MCAGYLADQIESEFGDGSDLDVEIKYSKETYPLGTAGAIKLAECHLGKVSEFLVMNGDSFLEIDIDRLIQFHRDHGALASMAVVEVEDASRFGTVEVDPQHKVIGFQEKVGISRVGLVNAGVYVFDLNIFEQIPDGPGSLEQDVFPRLFGKGVFALEHRGMFIDIGTPEDYARAQELCDQLYERALSKLGSN
jgi:NDP-sugar pyrophosphorylase family protein